MKNVNMTINNIAVQTPVPSFPPTAPGAMPESKKVYAVSFSVQFDDEAEALKLAATLLNIVTGDSE
jgi:hypothetical protein